MRFRSYCVNGVSYKRRQYSPIILHVGTVGEQVYELIHFFFNLAIDGGVWRTTRPGRCTPIESPDTHCTGGWVGPKAGVDEYGRSRPYWSSNTEPSGLKRVAILPTLSGPAHVTCTG